MNTIYEPPGLSRWFWKTTGINPAARTRASGLCISIITALLLAIVVSHGCHRDEFDHEPCLIIQPQQQP